MTPAWHDNDNAVREDDLQAYVDGLLDGRRRAAIEAYLAAHPAEAARVAAYRAQNIGLHALFDPLPGLPVSASANDDPAALPPAMAALAGALDAQLQRPAAAPAAPAAPPRRNVPRLVAGIALLLSAGAAGWIALAQSDRHDTPLTVFFQPAPEALTPPATLEPAVQSSPAGTGGRKIKNAETPASTVDPEIEKPQPLPEQTETPKDT